MGGPENAADVMIAALSERNIAAKREEVESFFSRERSSADNMTTWTLEHLSDDVLLSQEELALYVCVLSDIIGLPITGFFRYSKLEGSGAVEHLLRSPDVPASRPFLEQDIRTATEALEASTSTIEEQTNTLNLQLSNLNKQVRLESERRRARGRDSARLHRKHELEKQNVAAAVRVTCDAYNMVWSVAKSIHTVQ